MIFVVRSPLVPTLFAALVALSGVACSAAEQSAAPAEPDTLAEDPAGLTAAGLPIVAAPVRKVAGVKVEGAGDIDFEELEDGVLLVTADFAEGRVPASYQSFARGELDAAALYRGLARAEAPAELARVIARQSDDQRRNPPEPEGADTEDGAGVLTGTRGEAIGVTSQALTAGQFQNKFCGGNWDFMYCWPQTGGNPWVQRKAYAFHGVVEALQHTVRARLRYRWAGSWHTTSDRQVLPGHWMHRRLTAFPRVRVRFEVLNNTHPLRFAAFGID